MKDSGRLLWLGVGLALGVTAAYWLRPNAVLPALAGNDRVEDYIISTGPVTVNVNVLADGVWILDYRAGKLLGTIVDRNLGTLLNWAEVDLVKEFNIPPRQNVHFLMTAGTPIAGQTALYVAEINSGKFGVYTMAPDNRGMIIRNHDRKQFRALPAAAEPVDDVLSEPERQRRAKLCPSLALGSVKSRRVQKMPQAVQLRFKKALAQVDTC